MYYRFMLSGNSVYMKMQMMPNYQRPAGTPKPKSADLDWLHAFTEAAARWCFAEAEAESFTSKSLSLQGRSYSGLTDKYGRTYISIQEYANQANLVVNWNSEEARQSYTKAGVPYLFLLGAASYKKGSEWIKTDGVVVV